MGFSFNSMTPAMHQRMLERMAERDRRAIKLVNEWPGMSKEEAYMRANYEMESESWAASEEIKLKDIRENGT